MSPITVACALSLTPLHALVGPNDSGKTTLLTALLTLGLWASRLPDPESQARRDRLTERFLRGGADAALTLRTGGSEWSVRADGKAPLERLGREGGWSTIARGCPVVSRVVGENLGHPDRDTLRAAIQGVTLVRLDPDALRLPSSLSPEGEPVRLRDERGTGLPGVLDALQARSLETIAELNDRLRSLFPTFRSLRLRNTSTHEKALGILLQGGAEVSADEMSEGMLYSLALMVLEHLDPTPLVLVEEPENGLHPARIREVMQVLRKLSDRVQIVLATHSPLVVNELNGDEVTVVTRLAATGTQTVRLNETPG